MPKAKNLDTGVISNVGPNFLKTQPKPFIANSGKYYKDGVWVPYAEPPLSDEASKLINDAKASAGTGTKEPVKETTQDQVKESAKVETTKTETPKSEAKAEDKKPA